MKNKNTLSHYPYAIKYLFVLVTLVELLFGNDVDATPVNTPNLVYKTPVKKRKKVEKRKFTHGENETLVELTEKYGTSSWGLVANEMKERNPRQCRDRWKHYLSPDVNKDEWSKEEDRLLLEKYQIFGKKWSKIAIFLPNRSDVQVRNRYFSLQRSMVKNKSQNSKKNKINSPSLTVNQPPVVNLPLTINIQPTINLFPIIDPNPPQTISLVPPITNLQLTTNPQPTSYFSNRILQTGNRFQQPQIAINRNQAINPPEPPVNNNLQSTPTAKGNQEKNSFKDYNFDDDYDENDGHNPFFNNFDDFDNFN